MAWALSTDGVDDRLELASTELLHQNLTAWRAEVRIKIISYSTSDTFYLWGSSSTFASGIRFLGTSIRIRYNTTDVTISSITRLDDGVFHTLTLGRDSSGEHFYTIDGVPEGNNPTQTATSSTPLDLLLLNFTPDVNRCVESELEYIKLYDSDVGGTELFSWDATASDHSGSTDQPILTDTVGGNDATGVGFPSFDASVWVNLGGGGEELIIDSGSFTISGTTQPLKSSFNTITESGNYALTGTASGLIYNGSIVNESGTYTLIGADADLKSVFNIISESGQYNLTGTEVTLIYSPGSGEIITIDSGAFQLLGTEQNLKYNAKLIVNPGDYSLSGTQTQIKYNGNVPLDSGSYLYNGSNINLVANYGIITGIGNYSLLGSVVSLIYSGDTNQQIGVVTAGFKENTISTNYKPNSITVNFKGS